METIEANGLQTADPLREVLDRTGRVVGMPNYIPVEVGQVWEDNSKRGSGRRFEIVEMCPPYVTAKITDPGRWNKDLGPEPPGRKFLVGQTRKIHVNGFKKLTSGYRFISKGKDSK